MNKIKIYFFLFICSFFNIAHSAEYGIGVGVNNYNYYVYLPINIAESDYRIEPMLYYSDYTTTYDNTYSKYYGLGIGLFKVFSQSANTKIYIGARLATSVSEGDSSGYVKTTANSLMPTFGFEYYLAENLTLGGEVYLDFQKSTSTNSVIVNSKQSATMVTMKYYFKQ